MSPRQRFVLVPLVLVAVVLTGCSGSDDGAATTAAITDRSASATTAAGSATPLTSEPTSTTAPTTVAETDPTATVSAPTTVESTTSTASTTDVPTSDTPGTPETAVVEAVEFFEQQWKECLRTLPDCDEVIVAMRRLGDVNVETSITASLFNDGDYRAGRIEELEYRVDDVAVAEDGMTAQAVVCVTDPVEITQADGTPVDGAYLTSVQEFGLELRDEEWSWTTRRIGETFEGEENSVCV